MSLARVDDDSLAAELKAARLDDARQEAAEDKAAFCLRTGVQPSEYDQLTDVERNAFVRELERLSNQS